MSACPAFSDVYRLSFLLPATLVLRAMPGRHQPCLHGCVLRVDRGGTVTVEGPSRPRVFEQAARFLRMVAKGMPPVAIAAWLASPCDRRDGWQIIVNAEVSFAPTAIEPHLADQAAG